MHLFLNGAKQFGLEHHGQFADFIQEQGPFFRLLEKPLAVGFGIGEGTALVAEKFAFQKRFRQGRTIDGNKRCVAAFALPVQGSSDQLLAGTALTRDEDGNTGFRHADDLGKQRFHGRAVAQ